MMADLAWHADYLKQLSDQKIPVLWRPLHEIDGGWFWWTCAKDAKITAEPWKITFNYLVNTRGFHNMLWVYSAGIETANPTSSTIDQASVNWCKTYYPGA